MAKMYLKKSVTVPPEDEQPHKAPVVQCEKTRCPTCGSTERSGYHNVMEQQYGGVDLKGRPYTHIVRRRTVCGGCGQARIDRTYENRA
jgi:hypothetical protein